MNSEVIKAMSKKEKKHPMRDWWNKNSYKIARVVFFPIWFFIVAKERIRKELDSRQVWDEERAQEIFSYFIPRASHWVEEEKAFDFFDNGMGWSMYFAKRHLKRKDRRFWKVNTCFDGGNLRKYLIEKFELEGFQKEIGDCNGGWTTLYFKLIEK